MKLCLFLTLLVTCQYHVLGLQTPLPKSPNNKKVDLPEKVPSVPSKNIPNDPGLNEVLRNVQRARVFPLWSMLTRKVKDEVKAWFLERGNFNAVPFAELVEFFRANRQAVEDNYHKVWNVDIRYPDYYTQAFHGYDMGNLCFEAAEDCLPATFSISVTYWPQVNGMESSQWMRNNFTDAVVDYIQEFSSLDSPKKIVDYASSIGVSSRSLLETFDDSHVALLDLSPHFLATAKMLFEAEGSMLKLDDTSRVSYHHQLGEQTSFATNSQDLVSMSFLVHELPADVTLQVFQEALRILKPGGVIAVLDLEPEVLKALPASRRFLFGVTEPHIKEYMENNPTTLDILRQAGFEHVQKDKNDPMNFRLFGVKSKN